ncbi:MAG: hypothetical protein AAGN82_29220, partial [Myxococcota bacterium]
VAVEPLPVATPVQQRGKGRFGVAVAFVLLLLLFTVAVSIVMRPRGHDRPPELSHHFDTHQVEPARGALV